MSRRGKKRSEDNEPFDMFNPRSSRRSRPEPMEIVAPVSEDNDLPEIQMGERIDVPLNAVINIFSYLNQDDLANVRLCCRNYNQIVSRIGASQMQMRELDAIEISAHYEYTIRAFDMTGRMRTISFKKYFCERDIYGVERRDLDRNRYINYRYGCVHDFYDRIPPRIQWTSMADMERLCSGKLLRIYRHPHRHNRVNYASKIFTPPLDFYVRWQWVLQNCNVQHYVFVNFPFTELMVEKFEEYFGTAGFQCKILHVHNCSLKHISPESFHRLIGHFIIAKNYVLHFNRNALPRHIGNELLNTPGFLRADNIILGETKNRRMRPTFRSDLEYDQILEFAEKRKEYGKEHGVFAMAHPSFDAKMAVKDYQREYMRKGAPEHWFHSVTFETENYVDESVEVHP